MPFEDELGDGVEVVEYDEAWPAESAALAASLSKPLGDLAISIDHIGSTAVPGLPAKNCIDVQIRVRNVADDAIAAALRANGFRIRPDLYGYGRIKVPATEILMQAAECWATRTGWSASPWGNASSVR